MLKVRETTLTGNRHTDEWKTSRFDRVGSSERKIHGNFDLETEEKRGSTEGSHIITLTAMDIRTFVVTLGE